MGSGLGQPSARWPWGLDKSLSICHFLKAGTKVSAWKVSSVASSDPI